MTESARQEFRTADGLTLVADVAGPESAPLVVLLHGGGQTRHSWAGAMKSLVEAGYRVVNLDARGHGESDWSADRAYSLQARVEDVRAVVRDCDTPYALVGASMGGLTSIQAVGEGLKPAAVILVDIVPDMEQSGVDRIVGFMNSNFGGFATLEEAADAVASYYPERKRPKDSSGLMKNLRRHEDGRLYWHWDPVMFDIEDPAHFRKPLEHSTRKIGEDGDVPILVVRGMLSDIVSQAGIDSFKASVPHLEIANVGGAGHMVAGDKNDVFNSAVIGFLARHMPLGI